MPDAIFDHPRLAAIYDAFDGARADLDLYTGIAGELGAGHVLDVGCGTGCLAVRLAGLGLRVTAVDPAAASLDVARAKPGADRVTWIHGDATTLPNLATPPDGTGPPGPPDEADPPGPPDLATMTGNVAQVFLADEDWAATLRGVHGALRDGGVLVFETRRPHRRAWEAWAADTGPVVRDVPGAGAVEQRREVARVALPFVSFRYTYTFGDGTRLRSDSTLRFRDRPEVERSLTAAGFAVEEVRDAPDRPGLEDVYLARKDAARKLSPAGP
ncbi:class I SAM-dependent methyltransferase [Dactylosporangium aurantiacum]|uniref:Class I SAM-dependent methyltransferase n=1 Tax=Dactylosporangium aurantiacum TaxID=35754 RepID=A0A9Q9I925_9ACTN|nr:class I SAM-dependent methyltransferase [Dactylosporangium aurantiacum]MDG6105122.1 class I SAM-dependent methyltransferase [Dactylosporangium aurantiacum]UWZ51647.1 class I SAM-dependent methyltransferase [Dactylosporangium aurantiacum]